MNSSSHRSSYRIPVKLRLVIGVLDIIALVLALAATIAVPYFSETVQDLLEFRPTPDVLNQRFYSYGILCSLLLLSFAHSGHYTRRVPWWGQVQFMLKALALALVVDGFTYFSLQYPFSRYLIMANWLFAALFLLAARQLAFSLVALSKEWRMPVALLGDRQMVMDCMFAFYADGCTGYEVKTILLRDIEGEFDMGFIPRSHPPVQLEHVGNNYAAFIHANPHYFYILSLDGFRGESRDKLMNALEAADVEYAIIPPIKRLHLHGMEPHYFFGNDIMLLHKRHTIETPLGRAAKRLMDVMVSGLALLPLALVLAVVVVMRRVEGGTDTPLFYGGERVGRDGKLFKCWKFCTMRTDGDRVLAELLASDPAAKAEWDTFQKLRNDPRIDSRISACLRKTSLDELPQLWNVFVGDMSLVGPRPILENQIPDYGDAVRSYISVRPGLTGLWQVSGRNETSFKQRVNWDNWYIRNWSLWHDFVILFKTAKVLVSGSGAY